jgi:hypothetical protein
MIKREYKKMMMSETALGPNSQFSKIRNELSFWTFLKLKDDVFGPPLSDFTMMMMSPYKTLFFKK